MRVIAHRGANREALENSWQAFELAIEGGAERIELDVQMTRDGHAVINHDDSLMKTTGKPLYISKLTREEITQLSLNNGEPIPFLAEVVERILPRIELNIEIKGHSTQLAKVVCSLVGQHQRRDKVIVSSFCIEPLKWIAKNKSNITRACLWGGWDTYSWPFFAHSAPQIFMEETHSQILHPQASLVTENLMDQANWREWQVFAWCTMDGEEQDRDGLWAHLHTLKVDGLCTNYPRQLRAWVEEATHEEEQYYGKTVEPCNRDI